MNTRQLEYVLAVAQTRSFSDAAKQLWISQPSLSQYIQKLEHELNIKLFERAVPLRLTYAGRVYLESAQKILAEEKRMKDQLADITREQRGQIVIGAGPLNSMTILPPVIANLLRVYPNVEVKILEMTEPELMNHSETGEMDLILTAMPVNRNKFEYVRVTNEDFLMVVPLAFEVNRHLGGNVKSACPERSIHDFKGEPFVVMDSNLPARIKLDELCSEQGIHLKNAVQCGSLVSSYEMVNMGAGVALMPSNAVHRHHQNICCYRIRELNCPREIGVFYLKGKYLTQAMKELLRLFVCPPEN
jgi:DNA-binding transcriptional LysR family regulator